MVARSGKHQAGRVTTGQKSPKQTLQEKTEPDRISEQRVAGERGSADAARNDLIHRTALAEPAFLADPGEYSKALQVERAREGEDLAVYVHLPFCPSRCLTCDNQTTVSHESRQVDRYIDALEREIRLVTDHLGTNRRLQQLHLGGGTPNYLSDLQLVRLIDILDQHFTMDDDTDTTLEANAHRASFTQLTLLHGLGFRGLNLELRDLDPRVQDALGRRQSLTVVRDVVESARAIGFSRVSTDLVYGLPRQTAASMRSTIEKLVALEPDRISCSTYARRPEAFRHQSAVDKGQLPSLGDKVAIFSRIVEGLGDAGYEWVGLDCFARPEDDIARAHRSGDLRRNWIGYTARQGRSLLGLGSSAGSELSTFSTRNTCSVDAWREALEGDRLPLETATPLNPKLHERRHALSDLLCNLQRDASLSAALGAPRDGSLVQCLEEDGLIEVDRDIVSVTDTGRATLNQLWGSTSPAALASA